MSRGMRREEAGTRWAWGKECTRTHMRTHAHMHTHTHAHMQTQLRGSSRAGEGAEAVDKHPSRTGRWEGGLQRRGNSWEAGRLGSQPDGLCFVS